MSVNERKLEVESEPTLVTFHSTLFLLVKQLFISMKQTALIEKE